MDSLSPILKIKSKMDIFEAENAKLPQVVCPLVHRFTDGMYIREIHMPAGIVVTSRIHKTQHPYVITMGVCEVVKEDGTHELLKAPHTGITEKGTRRVLLIHEDTVWTTFHITDKTDPVEIENDITYTDNELLPKDFRQGYLGSEHDTTIGQEALCLA